MTSASVVPAPLLAPVAVPMEFPFVAPPALGEVTLIRPGCYWLRMPLPYALDHINLWMLRDGDGYSIVDTGFNQAATHEAWEKILATLGAKVKRLIVTHGHPDHVGLAGWFHRKFEAPLWMPQGEFLGTHAMYNDTAGHDTGQVVDLFAAHGLDAATQAGMRQRGNTYRVGVSDPPNRYRRIFDGERIRVGEHDWRVISGFGHSPEHAALYCADLDLLIAGDMLLPKISTNVGVWGLEPESDPVRLFLESIDRFRPLPATTLALPSHGLPFRGIHARIEHLHQHHRERLDEVLEKCVEPMTAHALLGVLFRRALDAHQTFFAMGEAIAHLNYLWHRGALVRDKGDDQVYRFRRPH